ncbi:isopentenyl-diphosphate Delta-isomerase [[Clostridium] polysaccharolyticum]|uniref:Isopentenyl-diphosphate delta-isomerase n=1 Tax=[Clostridium] polysaccharolyticum TaxID=29364 RepID=A0A1I0ABA7_9FIRM|nr:isopentenyl-diphosphate Delta-isomerase [[Clostridium] polysaccharolyticum]SES91507.1 isopentenyl-diphosphate delta-isomerase [[Clostridium] polysaccharolyticum]
MNKLVICVDEQDNGLGVMEKMEAHEKGILHRAFSIFVWNQKEELMIHQRALEKYHSGGLWTNTCCSHPQPGEELLESAHKRLIAEMGFDCNLKESFSFLYQTEFEDGLVEHEFDHVIMGCYEGAATPNPEEVCDYKWVPLDELERDMKVNPKKYTVWFRIAMEKVQKLYCRN